MLNEGEIFDGNTFVRRGRGRPKSETAKEQISVRLDPDVLAKLREAGPGWQSQINAILKRALMQQPSRSHAETISTRPPAKARRRAAT